MKKQFYSILILMITLFMITCTESKKSLINTSWKDIQIRYYQLKGDKKRSTRIIEHHIASLDRIDRCITCHIGMTSNESFGNNHLFRRHSKSILSQHRVEKFGCTPCHKGDGQALTYQKASHGSMTPLKYMQSTCSQCHDNTQNGYRLSYGKYLISRTGCYNCHTIKGFEKTVSTVVSLNGIADKVQLNWIIEWLSHPSRYAKHSKMPKYFLSESETKKIVHFLSTLKNHSLKEAIQKRGDSKKGKQLYQLSGCSQCHIRKGNGGTIGPELTYSSRKLKRKWLIPFLKNPKAFYPKTKMPKYHFTEQQILDIVEFLMTGKDSKEISFTPKKSWVVEGSELYVANGCVGCHSVKGLSKRIIAPNLNHLHDIEPNSIYSASSKPSRLLLGEAIFLKIKDSHYKSFLRMPQYNLSDKEIDHITTYLLGLKEHLLSTNFKMLSQSEAQAKQHTLMKHWTVPVSPQKVPPKDYSRQEASLNPNSCGICHKQQYQDWRTTLHSKSMSPGVVGQFIDKREKNPEYPYSCRLCHAPLSEQQEHLYFDNDDIDELERNIAYDSSLSKTGVSCTVCHVRSHNRISSVKKESSSLRPFLPRKYQIHGGVNRYNWFKQSEFCSVCHQFSKMGQPGRILNKKPLENTYNEWKESSWSKKGISCQECHMPNKRHLWKGIHDPDMVRSGVKLDVKLIESEEKVIADIRLINSRVGHHFPTYVTPAVFIIAELLDNRGETVPDTQKKDQIRRALNSKLTKELFDTRIPSGKTHTFRYEYSKPKTAKSLKVTVEVHPDHFYLGFFKNRLKSKNTSQEAKTFYQKAKDHNEKSPYILYQKTFPLNQ